MKKALPYLALLAVLLVASVLFFRSNRSDESAIAEVLPRTVIPQVEPEEPQLAKPAETLPEERVIPIAEQELGEEVRATRRMYLAHASLRKPEVADPDSIENKKIMQQMIANAIARKSAASDAEASAN